VTVKRRKVKSSTFGPSSALYNCCGVPVIPPIRGIRGAGRNGLEKVLMLESVNQMSKQLTRYIRGSFLL